MTHDQLMCFWGQLQQSLNVWLNIDSLKLSAVSLEGLALWPNQKLLKIPGNIIPTDGTPDQIFGVLHQWHRVIIWIRELVFQVGKDRMCITPIYNALFKNGERRFIPFTWTYILQGIQNFSIRGVLLENIKIDKVGKIQKYKIMYNIQYCIWRQTTTELYSDSNCFSHGRL